MDGLSQRNYKTKIKNNDMAITAISGAINCQNMAISGPINRQNMAISGAINSQKGRQILYHFFSSLWTQKLHQFGNKGYQKQKRTFLKFMAQDKLISWQSMPPETAQFQ